MTRLSIQKPSEKGQSFVELAICLILLVMLIVAIADFGRAFFTFVAIRDAAQEGAAYASTNPTDLAGIQSRVQNSSTQPVNLTGANIVVTTSYGGAVCAGNTVTVQVDFNNFAITTPFLGSILGTQSLNLHARASDTILRPYCH